MKIPRLCLIELEFRTIDRIINLPFYHGIHWNALFREALKKHNLSELNLWVQSVETAVFEYREQEKLKVGITFPVEQALPFSKILQTLKDNKNFRGHFIPSKTVELIGANCRITGKPWRPEDTEALSYKALLSEVEELLSLKEFTLLFYSPLRAKRPEGFKTEGHTYLDHEFFTLTEGSNLLEHLFSKVRLIDQKPELKELSVQNAHLLWLDIPYGEKTLGGVVGAIKVRGKLNINQAKFLTLSQYLGIGKNPSFGFGFFTIAELESVKTIKPLSRGTTLLSRLISKEDSQANSLLEQTLNNLLRHIKTSSSENGSILSKLHSNGYQRAFLLETSILNHIQDKLLLSSLFKALFPQDPIADVILTNLTIKTNDSNQSFILSLLSKSQPLRLRLDETCDLLILTLTDSLLLLFKNKEQEEIMAALNQLLLTNRLKLESPNPDTLSNLSFLSNQGIKILGKISQAKNETQSPSFSSDWSRLFSSDDDWRLSVYITINTNQAYSEGAYLTVKDQKGQGNRIPWSQIGRIYILGSSNFSYSLVNKALSEGIPIAFLDIFGKPKGFLYPESYRKQDLTELQTERKRDSEFCLTFAKEIISAKIHNSSVILRRNSLGNEELREIIGKVEKAKDLEILRGYEGMASKLYFQGLSKLVEPFEFYKRVYYPPEGPINAMLSLGYTLLYYRIAASLKLHGLNPRIGFYHKGRGSHLSLASDLLEELRHIVERVTLSLIHLRIIKEEDFINNRPDRQLSMLTYQGLLKYLRRFEKVMSTRTVYYQKNSLTYNEYIDMMAVNLTRALRGEAPYRALRIQ